VSAIKIRAKAERDKDSREVAEFVMLWDAADEVSGNVLQVVDLSNRIAEVELDLANVRQAFIVRIQKSLERAVEGEGPAKVDADTVIELVYKNVVSDASDAQEIALMRFVGNLSPVSYSGST